jgi:hypothetical protein
LANLLWKRCDELGKLHRCIQRSAMRYNTIDQPHGQGLVALHGPSRENEIKSPTQPNNALQPNSASCFSEAD